MRRTLLVKTKYGNDPVPVVRLSERGTEWTGYDYMYRFPTGLLRLTSRKCESDGARIDPCMRPVLPEARRGRGACPNCPCEPNKIIITILKTQEAEMCSVIRIWPMHVRAVCTTSDVYPNGKRGRYHIPRMRWEGNCQPKTQAGSVRRKR
jgi:hypothetical protein